MADIPAAAGHAASKQGADRVEEASASNGVATALKTGRALFLLQVVSRLLTFVLNSSLLRLSSPEVLGTASIQFDLISATILFLSREGIRNALLRRGPSPLTAEEPSNDADGAADKPKPAKYAYWQSRVNGRLACLPLPIGVIVAAAVVSLYVTYSPDSTTSQTDFYFALASYVVAALMELMIEPYYIKCLTSSPPRVGVRVSAEGGMAMMKAIITFGLLYIQPQRPLLAFAMGQFGGAFFLARRYIMEYGTGEIIWIPRFPKERMFDEKMSALAWANTKQSFIKHFLTEADRIAVGAISPLSDQGGYAVAMNYGSLIARIVFQPIEETLLLHFSSDPSGPANGPLISFITHISSHLLLLLPSFLPPLLPPVLSVLLPKKYLLTSAPSTLQTYLCFYIPLLSLNGVLEAYHTATATPRQMTIQTRWMIASSGVFVAALFAFKGVLQTETALISASCVAMGVRILYAYLHAKTQAGMGVRALLPKSAVTITSVICGSVLRRVYKTGRWTQGWSTWFELLGFGGVLGLATLGVIYRVERREFAALQQTLKQKKA